MATPAASTPNLPVSRPLPDQLGAHLAGLDSPPTVYPVPDQLLARLLVAHWQRVGTDPAPDAPLPPAGRLDCYLTPDQAEAIADSPLAHVLADLRPDHCTVTVTNDDDCPPVIAGDTTGIIPLALGDAPQFLEVHPPEGGFPTPTPAGSTPSLTATPAGTTICRAFAEHVPGATTAAVPATFSAYAASGPTPAVDLGYLLVLAAGAVQAPIRAVAALADDSGLVSKSAVYRRKRRLEEYGLLETRKQATGTSGQNPEYAVLVDGEPAPTSELASALQSIAAALDARFP